MEEKKQNNKMREIKIEKVVLNIGGVAEELEKGVKLLEILVPERKPARTRSRKRIPSLGVRPNLEVGTVVTLRSGMEDFLKKIFVAIDGVIKKKQVSENNFSFGVKEYIEIPGMEYQRDIGIMGFDVTVVFKRAGRRVRLKKIKRGKIPKRQVITREEIIKFMEENFQVKFI
ncbi:MAG: 50S ribosomal protein L5 [Candidatus Pacearchaeota archaeon]|nr:50S ribosomal protein L5 [Candidatus Pacearchaeota archaeon]